MSPHWRAQFQPAWTLAALAPVVGRQVRVVGQLLVDNEHFDPKRRLRVPRRRPTCWRASVWELHPVTRFQVCSSGTCSETGGGWVDLEDLGTAVASAAPAATSSSPAAGGAPAR